MGTELQAGGNCWDRSQAGTQPLVPPPKTFCILQSWNYSDQSFGHKNSLPALARRRRAQLEESFLSVAQEPTLLEPFGVTLEGGGTPVQSHSFHLHGMGQIHPKNIFRQWANDFMLFWGIIMSSVTIHTPNTHFSISSHLNSFSPSSRETLSSQHWSKVLFPHRCLLLEENAMILGN